MRKLKAFLMAGVLAALAAVPAGPQCFAQDSGLKANLDLPFDAVGENQEEEEAPEVIVFYGQQYEGDFFCFICDRSRSMEGERWKKLQREVVKNITQFSERVEFAIVFFAGDVQKFPSSGQPANANPGMKGAAIAMVTSTSLGRGSCYKEGLLEGLQFAARSSSLRKVMICLGDGDMYCKGQDKQQYGQQTLATVKERNVFAARINSVGINTSGAGEEWLRSLATQNNGQYRKGE